MRKFWGWALFLIGLLDAGVIWYNLALAPWRYESRGDWVVIIYLLVMGLCVYGWYKLALHKKKEDYN